MAGAEKEALSDKCTGRVLHAADVFLPDRHYRALIDVRNSSHHQSQAHVHSCFGRSGLATSKRHRPESPTVNSGG